jgi:hypothetical protein
MAESRARQQAIRDEQTRTRLATFVEALRRSGAKPAEVERLSKLYAERLAQHAY